MIHCLYKQCVCSRRDSILNSHSWADRGWHLWSFIRQAIEIAHVQALKLWLVHVAWTFLWSTNNYSALKVTMQAQQSMPRVAPGPQQLRNMYSLSSLEPPMYSARSLGDKLHLDQNEKLTMYRVTHMMAVDGFSCKIVGFVTTCTVLHTKRPKAAL